MKIREYRPEDFDKVLRVMCDAFSKDRLYEYFIEDHAQRQNFLNLFMKFRLRFGVKKGQFFVTDDVEGVIILLRPNETMSPADLIRYGGLKAMLSCGSAQRKRIMVFNTFADTQAAGHMKHTFPPCASPPGPRGRAGAPPCCAALWKPWRPARTPVTWKRKIPETSRFITSTASGTFRTFRCRVPISETTPCSIL